MERSTVMSPSILLFLLTNLLVTLILFKFLGFGAAIILLVPLIWVANLALVILMSLFDDLKGGLE